MTTKQKMKGNIVICLAGLTACGKSTVAKRLAEKYGLQYLSGGSALKELAIKMGYGTEEKGWWETSEGMKFLEHRLHDSSFDQKVDEQLLQWAQRGNVILDSWTMPWLSKTGFKIWLEASPKIRAQRLAKRDNITVQEAENAVAEKDRKTKQIYERLYGFKLGEDFSPFDLILDTDRLNADEVYEVLDLVIDRLVFRKSR
jgi:cytidylate kinase